MSTTPTPTLHTMTFADMANLDLRDQVVTVEAAPLTVVGGSYGKVPTADVLAGIAPLIEVRLSADGRHWASNWHSGPTADGVYVERWTAEGRVFHGYVDSVSRRIVQSG